MVNDLRPAKPEKRARRKEAGKVTLGPGTSLANCANGMLPADGACYAAQGTVLRMMRAQAAALIETIDLALTEI